MKLSATELFKTINAGSSVKETKEVNVIDVKEKEVKEEIEKEVEETIEVKDNTLVIEDKEYLEKKISEFLATHSHLAPQGSAEWKNRNHFGGSEIAHLNGTNTFGSLHDLIKNRCNLTEHKIPIINSRWGHVMEDVSINIIETLFNTKIYQTGSIPYDRNKNIAYSPDGICIIDIKAIRDMALKMSDLNIRFHEEMNSKRAFKKNVVFDRVTYDDKENKEKIVLLEFKSPPKQCPMGVIPSYYVAQPLAGLNCIDICYKAFFINCMYRRCGIDDIEGKTYDAILHDKDINGTGRNTIKLIDLDSFDVLYYGCVLCQSQEDINTEINMVDYGKSSIKDLENLFYKEEKGKINMSVSTFFPNDGSDRKKNILEFINSHSNIVGFMCWKLFKMDIIEVDRQETFLDDLKENVDKYIEIIRDIKSIENLNDRWGKYYEYFPEHKPIYDE